MRSTRSMPNTHTRTGRHLVRTTSSGSFAHISFATTAGLSFLCCGCCWCPSVSAWAPVCVPPTPPPPPTPTRSPYPCSREGVCCLPSCCVSLSSFVSHSPVSVCVRVCRPLPFSPSLARPHTPLSGVWGRRGEGGAKEKKRQEAVKHGR